MNKQARELLKKNNSRVKALFDENVEIFTDMIIYLRGSDLSDYNQELVREDILELIIDGQERGDSIEEVMGGSYKEICDEIIEAMPKKTRKDKIMEFAATSLSGLWVLGLIALIKTLIEIAISDNEGLDFVLTVGDIINAIAIIIIANVIVRYVTKTAFKTKKDKSIVLLFKTWLIAVVIIGALVLNSFLFQTVVASISLWIAAIAILSIFVIEKIISTRSLS